MRTTSVRDGVILTVALLIVGPVFMLAITIDFLAADRSQAVRLGWDTTLGSWDEVMARFPPTAANEAALELERCAATLGVALAPPFTERAPAAPEAKRAFGLLKRDVFGGYLTGQLEGVDRDRIEPPPAALSDFVGTHGPELEALYRALAGPELPVWESDLSRLSAAPLPNLLGQMDLQKLLASVTLAQLHAGDRAGALRTVEAAWNLSRTLRDSPLVISQLIYIASLQMQTGVLRHFRDLPAVWVERLRDPDFRRGFVTALKVEGWLWSYYKEVAPPSGGESDWLRDPLAAAARPYVALCLADVSDAWRKAVARLERVQVLCDNDLTGEGAAMDIELPRWNKIGGLLAPDLGGAVYRVARLELDRELLVLEAEADAARRANGAWSRPAVAERPSVACPADRWTYTRTGDRLEIALSREIAWPDQTGAILPQRVVLDLLD